MNGPQEATTDGGAHAGWLEIQRGQGELMVHCPDRAGTLVPLGACETCNGYDGAAFDPGHRHMYMVCAVEASAEEAKAPAREPRAEEAADGSETPVVGA